MQAIFNATRDFMRVFFSSLILLLLVTGCSGIRSIEIPSSETEGEWISEVGGSQTGPNPDRMYVRRKEEKYIIKEEPYSIASRKKDPELLGPQRTYSADSASAVRKTKGKKHKVAKMTRESCISMIGEARYNKYVKRYGGEAGALRRCLVLKRLRG